MFGLMPFERRQNSMSYNPFHEMEEMERAFFGNHSLSEFKTDIQDKGDSYELTTDLPGFAKEDIHLDLEGDVLTMAKNIVSALGDTGVKRIIWITGMGIHHEIKGIRGMMLNQLAKQRPEYIEAADTIAASSAVTTLLRCPGIQNGDNEVYELTKEGEQPSHRNVDRAAIARCMADMIAYKTLGANESLGITNGKN